MRVGADHVRSVAALARIGLPDDQVARMAQELSGILDHMDVLAAVDTSQAVGADVGGQGMPLRSDEEPSAPLVRPREAFAPEMRDGFFLVPRLASHNDSEHSV